MIQKYNLGGVRSLTLGSMTEFNKVDFQNYSLHLWVNNKGEHQELVEFKVCMTGEDSPKGFIFVGTALNSDASYVVHVYRSIMAQDIMKSIF